MYDVLAKGNLHEELEGLGGLYRVVGGLGLHAVVNAEEVSWASHSNSARWYFSPEASRKWNSS